MVSLAGNVMTGALNAPLPGHVARATPLQPTVMGLVVIPVTGPQGGPVSAGTPQTFPTTFAGAVQMSPGDCYFERMIVLPRRIDAGIILSTQVFALTLFNTFRDDDRTFVNFVNNTGVGTAITDLPALPAIIERLDALALTYQITIDGPPAINGTLDFVFDVEDGQIPVTATRSVLFPFEPEIPMTEILGFRTDVLSKRSGKEQRIALRKTPRQMFEMLVRIDEFDRQNMEAILFDSHERAFGLPMWHEARVLKADIAINDTSATVNTTAFADFRVGELAIVLNDPDDFEALEISAINPTSIDFTTPFQKAFQAGIRVMPVRIALLSPTARARRFRVDLKDQNLEFTVLDNDVDLADSSAFSTLFGKVFFDDANRVTDTMSESVRKPMTIIDNRVGAPEHLTDQPIERRSSTKGFVSKNSEELFQIRQVLHFLKGRAISFFIPTFFPELQVLAPGILSGSVNLDINNFGYTKFIQSRQPRNVIRVTLNDGTEIIRTVLSSNELSEDVDRLTVNTVWGVDAGASEIAQVDFIEKSRFNDDRIRIRHLEGNGTAEVVTPIVTVLE